MKSASKGNYLRNGGASVKIPILVKEMQGRGQKR